MEFGKGNGRRGIRGGAFLAGSSAPQTTPLFSPYTPGFPDRSAPITCTLGPRAIHGFRAELGPIGRGTGSAQKPFAASSCCHGDQSGVFFYGGRRGPNSLLPPRTSRLPPELPLILALRRCGPRGFFEGTQGEERIPPSPA